MKPPLPYAETQEILKGDEVSAAMILLGVDDAMILQALSDGEGIQCERDPKTGFHCMKGTLPDGRRFILSGYISSGTLDLRYLDAE